MKAPATAQLTRPLALAATIVTGLMADQWGGPWGQPLVSLWVWGLWLALMHHGSRHERTALLACLLYAAAGEAVLSLAWGLYDYRMGGIPLFVPPGHVLLYALGCQLAPRLPIRAIRPVALLAALAAVGLAASGHDHLSLALTLLLLASLRWGPTPRLYATMFLLALAMELWGTWLGNWHWQAHVPGLGWTTLNPPFAAGAFYCVLDWLVGITARATGAGNGAPPIPAAINSHTQ